MQALSLFVATFSNGDASLDSSSNSIWTDLEDVRPGEWRTLVSDRASAEATADRTGATLLSVDPWDGSRFGDGFSGIVEQVEPGVWSGPSLAESGFAAAGWVRA